jgi:hypothetical protein
MLGRMRSPRLVVYPAELMRTIRPSGTGRRNVFKFHRDPDPVSFFWQTLR